MSAIRPIHITVDTLLDLLKDFCKNEDIPADAKPVALARNVQEAGALGLRIASPSIRPGMPIIRARFDLRHMWTVGPPAMSQSTGGVDG